MCSSARVGVVGLWCQVYHSESKLDLAGGAVGSCLLSLPTETGFLCTSCGGPVLAWIVDPCRGNDLPVCRWDVAEAHSCRS